MTEIFKIGRIEVFKKSFLSFCSFTILLIDINWTLPHHFLVIYCPSYVMDSVDCQHFAVLCALNSLCY